MLDVSFLNKSNTTMEDVNWKISRRSKTIRSNSLRKSASAALLYSVDLSASLAAPVAYLLELTHENCSVLFYLNRSINYYYEAFIMITKVTILLLSIGTLLSFKIQLKKLNQQLFIISYKLYENNMVFLVLCYL